MSLKPHRPASRIGSMGNPSTSGRASQPTHSGDDDSEFQLGYPLHGGSYGAKDDLDAAPMHGSGYGSPGQF
ncbi:MAG: hypothetical protein V4681_03590 [Patescibacteria group bacterium]